MRLSSIAIISFCAGLGASIPYGNPDVPAAAQQQQLSHPVDLAKRKTHHKRQKHKFRGDRGGKEVKSDIDSTSTSTSTLYLTSTVLASLPSEAASLSGDEIQPSVTFADNGSSASAAADSDDYTVNAVSKVHKPSATHRGQQSFPSTFVSEDLPAASISSELATRALASTPASSAAAVSTGPATLWKPSPGTSFQIVLSDQIDITRPVAPNNVDVFDIDLFNTPTATITKLKSQGKKVMCYFSAGSSENWRPDFKQFTAADQGKGLATDDSGTSFWPGEKWLNTNSANVRKVMAARITLAAQKGCDAIDPDNMDAYNNDNGLRLTQADAVSYFTFLANTASKLKIAIGIKNALEILPQVSSFAQFAVNEECATFNECNRYNDFLKTKPVFHIEYLDQLTMPMKRSVAEKRLSNVAQSLQPHCSPRGVTGTMSTILKTYSLDGSIQFCDGTVATTHTLGF